MIGQTACTLVAIAADSMRVGTGDISVLRQFPFVVAKEANEILVQAVQFAGEATSRICYT